MLKSIIDMQRLQIQRLQHTKTHVNSIKPLQCGSMWYSTQTNEDKSTEMVVGAAETVNPQRTLKDKIMDYFFSSKSVCIIRKQTLFL